MVKTPPERIAMREVVVWIAEGVFLLFIIGLALRDAYAMFKAGTNTKPGYGFLSGFNVTYLLFRDTPFTDKGLKWCATFQRCFFGGIVAWVMLAIIIWLGRSN